MFSSSRRSFLAQSSLAATGIALGFPQWARAVPIQLKQPVSSLHPEIIASDILRDLALVGIDATRHADVTYSDIRVGNTKCFRVWWDSIHDKPAADMKLEYSYGVRVRVGGVWGFAFGTLPTREGIIEAARSAISTARGLARINNNSTELAPVPVARGDWKSPVEIDPFDVSPDDHGKILGAYMNSAKHVFGGTMGELSVEWYDDTRVFASSEGSLTTQQLLRSVPGIKVAGRHLGPRRVYLPVPGISIGSKGVEMLTGAPIQERIKELTEEAVQFASYPMGDIEVGRYEAVVDGTSFGAMLNTVLVPALEMDRVMGFEADGVGTSFLSPPLEVLGQPSFSRKLTLTANRNYPYYGAAKWDDEGVETKPYPVITEGRVVDYFATRDTAPVLSDWYASQGKRVALCGSAVSCAPTVSPSGMPTNLVVGAENGGPGLEAMIKSVKNGILIRSTGYLMTDSQLTGGFFTPRTLFEVKNGQITKRLKDGMAQFSTKPLLKGITQLGGTNTIQSHHIRTMRGEAYVQGISSIHSPAVHLEQLDLTDVPKPI